MEHDDVGALVAPLIHLLAETLEIFETPFPHLVAVVLSVAKLFTVHHVARVDDDHQWALGVMVVAAVFQHFPLRFVVVVMLEQAFALVAEFVELVVVDFLLPDTFEENRLKSTHKGSYDRSALVADFEHERIADQFG